MRILTDSSESIFQHTRLFLDAEPQIRGKTLGVIGYGDIGQTAARMAKGMGMKIIGQRRRPELSANDGIADEVFGPGQVRYLGRAYFSSVSFHRIENKTNGGVKAGSRKCIRRWDGGGHFC